MCIECTRFNRNDRHALARGMRGDKWIPPPVARIVEGSRGQDGRMHDFDTVIVCEKTIIGEKQYGYYKFEDMDNL